MKTELLGWIGATLLAFCGVPEVINAIQVGDSALTFTFLSMWGFGEIFALAYTLIKSKQVKLLPLIMNYGINLICISIIVILKIT